MNLEINTIYCGDCLPIMQDMQDDSVDLVLTDPPYGINENGHRNLSRTKLAQTKDYGDYQWDKQKVSDDHILLLVKVGKNQVVFGGNFYGSLLGDTRCYIVWDKDNGEVGFADCELAWTSFETAVRKIKYRWHGMLQENMGNKEVRFHPTQKPLGVMLWILERYSKPSDLIFDPFCGSGTTCVAAKRLGRNYIGIDISEEYCQIARDRLAAEEVGLTVKEMKKEQGNLFTVPR